MVGSLVGSDIDGPVVSGLGMVGTEDGPMVVPTGELVVPTASGADEIWVSKTDSKTSEWK